MPRRKKKGKLVEADAEEKETNIKQQGKGKKRWKNQLIKENRRSRKKTQRKTQ
jgi:hypothetical protein